MARWKWFQRPEQPIDCVGQATAYPDRAGAYRREPVESRTPEPSWNGPTRLIQRVLMTRGQEHRSQHAVRRGHR